MPLSDDLSQAVAAYRSRCISLDAFEDWFRTNSRGMFGESEEMLRACIAVESALSMLRFEDASNAEFQAALDDAVAPFALGPVYAPPRKIVFGEPRFEVGSANRYLRLVAEVA